MNLTILGIVLILISYICYKKKHEDTSMALLFFGAVGLFIGILFTIGEYQDQIKFIENKKANENLIVLRTTMSDSLAKEFKQILGKQYPEHELNIFKNLSPNQILLYAPRYPDIQASTVLMELTSEIKDLAQFVYKKQKEQEELSAKIRTNKRSILSISWLIPIE
jgi:hypothetical protein